MYDVVLISGALDDFMSLGDNSLSTRGDRSYVFLGCGHEIALSLARSLSRSLSLLIQLSHPTCFLMWRIMSITLQPFGSLSA